MLNDPIARYRVIFMIAYGLDVSRGGSCVEKKAKTKSSSKKWSSFKNARSMHVLLYLLLAAIMFALLFVHVKPETLDLDLFSVSDKTIYTPATVEDQKATEEKSKPLRTRLKINIH
nr:unknown [Bacillus subtilis]